MTMAINSYSKRIITMNLPVVSSHRGTDVKHKW